MYKKVEVRRVERDDEEAMVQVANPYHGEPELAAKDVMIDPDSAPPVEEYASQTESEEDESLVEMVLNAISGKTETPAPRETEHRHQVEQEVVELALKFAGYETITAQTVEYRDCPDDLEEGDSVTLRSIRLRFIGGARGFAPANAEVRFRP